MQGVPRVTRSRMENSHDRLEGSVARQGGPIALMMAAGIALAACSGGDDGLSEEEEATLQEQLDQAVADAAAQKAAKETAEKAKEAAEAAAKEAAAQAADAAAAAEAAADAAAEAVAGRTEAEGERDEAIAERDQAKADEAAAERRRLAALAEADREEQRRRDAEAAQAQAERDQEQLQRQLTEAEQAEFRARASSFGMELDDAPEGMATVTWPRGGSRTFRPSGVTHTSGSAAPSVPGGWHSASFTGQIGTVSPPSTLADETVYLYTNIQAPGTRAFWKKHGGNDLDVPQTEVASGLAKPSTSVSRTRETPGDSNTVYVSATTGGTYDGVSGTFSCTGDQNACTVTRTDGTTSIGTTTWTFKATSLNSGAPVDQDDAFLYFGIWSSIPDNINGEEYNFRYVAGGGAATGSALSGFDTLTGSATFRGGAVGKYVTQGQVGGQNAKIGTFTATATLNADFGAADDGSLSGSITDFREDGSPLTGWRVTLGSTDSVGEASMITSAAAEGSTVANIGGLAVGGSWGADFYGSTNDITGLDDREKYPAVDLAGVAGWFDATGSDASLAGAFAATPQ